ncbi:MAG: hypothetical protein V3V08_26290 [Nannocystaceae bacterium]
MAEVRTALENYLNRHDDDADDASGLSQLGSLLGSTDLTAARALAKDDPASAEAAARVIACLVVACAESQEVAETIKALAQRAPKDIEGNDVALLAGQVFWKVAGQPQLGEPYFRRVRRSDPANRHVVEFYRHLFSGPKDASQLMQVLVQARRETKDADDRFALAEEMANLASDRLGSVDRAIEVWRTVSREGSGDARVAARLESLYRDSGKWTALVELLKDEFEGIPRTEENRAARVGKLLGIVDLYRDQLKLDAMVLATLHRILEIDPSHTDSLVALAETYSKAKRYNDLLSVYGRLISSARQAKDGEQEAKLLRESASIWLDRLGNPQRALEPLKHVLELDATDAEALAMTSRIYERRGDWRALIGLRRRELDRRSGDDALDARMALARLAEDKLGDRREAIADWNAVIEHHGDVQPALAALSRLYERESRWLELSEVLHRRIAAVDDAEESVTLLSSLAVVYADRVQDRGNAIRAWREVLLRVPKHDKATRALRDAYVDLSRWDDLSELYLDQDEAEKLVDVFQRAADRVQGVEERVRLYRRVATLCRERIGQPERAVKALERTLAIAPTNYAVARELLPIYAEQSNWARLMGMHELLLHAAEDDEDRLACVEALRCIASEQLHSPTLTFQWSLRAYLLAPADDNLREQAEISAEQADGWDELTQAFLRRSDDPGTSEGERLGLLTKLALIARDRLGKPDDAQRYFRRVIELDPRDEGALRALEQIYSSTRRWDELSDVYARRLAVTPDEETRLATLRDLGRLREAELGELDGAVSAYRAILELRPKDGASLEALARIHRNRGEWEALANVLETRLAAGEDDPNRSEILFELSQIRATRLLESARAVEGFLEIVSRDSGHVRAVAALEELRQGDPSTAVPIMRGLLPYYRGISDRFREADAVEVLVSAEEDPEACREYLSQLAALYEQMPDRKVDALRIRGEQFEQRPQDWETRQVMRRLGTDLEKMDQVAGRYEVVLSGLATRMAAAERDGHPLDRSEYMMRRDLSLELAQILRDSLGRSRDAERVYGEILEQDETHQGAYEDLADLLSSREGYSDLFNLYRRRVDAVFNQREQKNLLGRMIELASGVLGEHDQALRTAEELVDLVPDDLPSIELLAGMYERRGEESGRGSLERLLGRWAELVQDAEFRQSLVCRRAEIRMQYLGDAGGAADLLSTVLGENPGHVRCRSLLEELLDIAEVQLQVSALLEPIYITLGEHENRIRVLHIRRAQAELAGALDEATSHLLEIARIEEHDLQNLATAFDAAREAYLTDPQRVDTRDEVERLGMALGREADLVDVWQRSLSSDRATDSVLRIDLTRRVAELLDRKLDDPAGARAAYMQLLSLHPPDLELARRTVENLCRLHLEAGDFAALVDAQRALLRFADDTQDQVALKLRIAEIQINHLQDSVGAALTWSEAVDLDPGQSVALDGLEQLFRSEQEWAPLCNVLEHRVSESSDTSLKIRLWSNIGEIRRERLGDAPGAVDAFRSLLELGPPTAAAIPALQALVDLGRGLEGWPEVEEALRKLFELVETDRDKIEILMDTAEIVGRDGTRGHDSLDLLRRVLELSPTEARARSFIRGFVDSDDTRDRALGILTPVYEAEQNWAALLELQEVHARRQPSGGRRLEALLRVARTHEERLENSDRAFSVLCDALSEAVDQPNLGEVLDKLEVLGRPDDLAEALLAAYDNSVDRILDSDLQQRVLRAMGAVALQRLGRLDRARSAYERLLELAPSEEASDALEQIYQRSEDHGRLVELLTRRAEREREEATRDGYLIRAAEICLKRRHQPEDAIQLYERLSVAGLARSEVQLAIDPLYEQTGRYGELATLLNHKLSRIEGTELVETHLRLGRLYGGKLGDPDEGVRHLGAALRLDPTHAVGTDELNRYLEDETMRQRVVEMLEPVFVAVQDWSRLIQIHEIKLAAAEDDAAKMRTLMRIAQLYEEQLEDLDKALDGYARVFECQPTNQYVRDQMHRLSNVLRKVDRYAEFLTRYVERDAAGEDDDDILLIVREAADSWALAVKQPARAVPLYRRLVTARFGGDEVFGAFEQALVAAELWGELLEAYWNEVDASLDETRQVDLLMRLAMKALDSGRDWEQAAKALRRVLERRPDHEHARRQLESVYSDAQQHAELLDLLRDRLDRLPAGRLRVEIQLRIADLQINVLKDAGGAVDTLEVLLGEVGANADAIRTFEEIAEHYPDQRQRVFASLEPIYLRENDVPRLISMTEWRLSVAEEPAARHQLYGELSRLVESGRGGVEQAFRTLVRALAEPGPDEALSELDLQVDRLAAALQMPEALADALISSAQGEGLSTDVARRLDLMVRGARIHLDTGEPNKAVEVLRDGLTLTESHEELLALLDDGLVRLGYHEELAGVITRRAAVVNDAGERAGLLRRLARLNEEVLAQPASAEAAWRELLEVEPADAEALARLSVAYEQSGSTQDLISVLERRIEATDDPSERRGLRMRLAAVHREAAKDRGGEIDALRALLGEAPTDDEAMAALARALAAEGRNAEAVDVIQERATLAGSDERKAALVLEAARVYSGPLEDRSTALSYYGSVLALVPGQEGALADLVELAQDVDVSEAASSIVCPQLEYQGRYAELAQVLRARGTFAEDPRDKSSMLAQLAALLHEKLGDPVGALDALVAGLDYLPVDELPSSLRRGTRLAVEAERVDAYVDALATRAADPARDPEIRVTFALAAADAETTLRGDRRRALDILTPLLDAEVADGKVLEQIEILGRAVGNAELVARALSEGTKHVSTPDLQSELFVRLGDIRVELEQPEAAAEAYCEALGVQSGLPTAVAGLELVLEKIDGSAQTVALDHLESVYEAEGNVSALTGLIRIRLRSAGTNGRGQLLQQLATLCEDGGGTATEAMHSWGELLAQDAESVEIRERLQKLAGEHGLLAQAGELMAAAVRAATQEGRNATQLCLATSRLRLVELSDPSGATTILTHILEGQPEHPEALDLLVAAARAANVPQQLHNALTRAAAIQVEVEKSIVLWREAVSVAENQLGEPQLAILDLQQLLEIDENSQASWSKILALLSASGDHQQLAEALRRRVAITEDADERHELSYRLANLLVDKLDQAEDAISVYGDLIASQPDDLVAGHELEVLLRRLDRWGDVYDLLERKSERSAPDQRHLVLEEMASIAERHLDNPATAIGLFQKIVREAGDASAAESALERLLRSEQRWSDLVDLMEVRMHRLDEAGETLAMRETASELAKLLAESLSDTDRAHKILSEILEIDDGYVPAILALASVHEIAGDDVAMSRALHRAASLEPTGAVGADLHIRLAQMAETREGRREHLDQALRLDPANTNVVAELLVLSREQGRWDQVAYLLEMAAGHAVDDQERLARMLERVDLMLGVLDDVDGALRLLAGIYEQVQDNIDVNRRIADALFQSERYEEATDMYEWLMEVDATGKRSKAQAHYLTRLARIRQAANDSSGALERLEQAYRVDTTNVETLIALGELHEEGEQWQDALKIYRSMLLQNADRSGLLARGDIYLRLATVHMGLGEGPKAAAMLRRGLEEDPSHGAIAEELGKLGA